MLRTKAETLRVLSRSSSSVRQCRETSPRTTVQNVTQTPAQALKTFQMLKMAYISDATTTRALLWCWTSINQRLTLTETKCTRASSQWTRLRMVSQPVWTLDRSSPLPTTFRRISNSCKMRRIEFQGNFLSFESKLAVPAMKALSLTKSRMSVSITAITWSSSWENKNKNKYFHSKLLSWQDNLSRCRLWGSESTVKLRCCAPTFTSRF